MAAARIFVPNGVGKLFTALSGFWLEGHYFITSAHFCAESLNQEEKDRHFLSLKDSTLPKASINSFAQAQNLTEVSRLAWLKIYDETADIAIFQASQQDTDEQKEHETLFKKDLIALSSPIQTQPVWTVAYSGTNDLLSVSPLQPFGPLSVEERKIRDNPASTKFDLLREWSIAALKAKERDRWSALAQPNTYKPPKFDDLFLTNMRALAVGEIYEAPSDDLQEEDELEKEMLHPYGTRGRHTVSGFYGCSGAMMCVFEDGNLDSPKVIGIFRGEFRKVHFNQFAKFTDDGLRWIFEAITSDAAPTAMLANLDIEANYAQQKYAGP